MTSMFLLPTGTGKSSDVTLRFHICHFGIHDTRGLGRFLVKDLLCPASTLSPDKSLGYDALTYGNLLLSDT